MSSTYHRSPSPSSNGGGVNDISGSPQRSSQRSSSNGGGEDQSAREIVNSSTRQQEANERSSSGLLDTPTHQHHHSSTYDRDVDTDGDHDDERNYPRRMSAPSKTLYVKYVPRDLPDNEVETLFKKYEGFVAIRKVRNIMFVEYTSAELATKAVERTQAYRFRSADKPLRIDYDRSVKSPYPPGGNSSSSSSSYHQSGTKRKYSDMVPGDNGYHQSYYPHSYPRNYYEPPVSRPRREQEYHGSTRSNNYNQDDVTSSNNRKSYDNAPNSSSSSTSAVSSRRSRSNSKEVSDSRRSQSPPQRRSSRSPPRRYPSSSSHESYDHYYSRHPTSSYYPYSRGKPVTLFVSNLPSDVTEREVSIMFRLTPYSAFKSLRLLKKERKTIAFVDFLDITSARYAIDTLQGFRLDYRETEGISIEFDKGTRSK